MLFRIGVAVVYWICVIVVAALQSGELVGSPGNEIKTIVKVLDSGEFREGGNDLWTTDWLWVGEGHKAADGRHFGMMAIWSGPDLVLMYCCDAKFFAACHIQRANDRKERWYFCNKELLAEHIGLVMAEDKTEDRRDESDKPSLLDFAIPKGGALYTVKMLESGELKAGGEARWIDTKRWVVEDREAADGRRLGMLASWGGGGLVLLWSVDGRCFAACWLGSSRDNPERWYFCDKELLAEYIGLAMAANRDEQVPAK